MTAIDPKQTLTQRNASGYASASYARAEAPGNHLRLQMYRLSSLERDGSRRQAVALLTEQPQTRVDCLRVV
jgi:hypothetical protein